MSEITSAKPVICDRCGEAIDFRCFPAAIHVVGEKNFHIGCVTSKPDLRDDRIAELEKALTWQPIDTAPKDGTWIMGWASGDLNPSRISWGRNYNNNLSWCTAFCSFVEGYITHWTPLPRTTLEASERGGE